MGWLAGCFKPHGSLPLYENEHSSCTECSKLPGSLLPAEPVRTTSLADSSAQRLATSINGKTAALANGESDDKLSAEDILLFSISEVSDAAGAVSFLYCSRQDLFSVHQGQSASGSPGTDKLLKAAFWRSYAGANYQQGCPRLSSGTCESTGSDSFRVKQFTGRATLTQPRVLTNALCKVRHLMQGGAVSYISHVKHCVRGLPGQAHRIYVHQSKHLSPQAGAVHIAAAGNVEPT